MLKKSSDRVVRVPRWGGESGQRLAIAYTIENIIPACSLEQLEIIPKDRKTHALG